MATYKTPGVYVQEISLFPPSIAEVATAIPAFIGYTERAEYKGQSLTNIPTRITSMVEFREIFGSTPRCKSIQVDLDGSNTPVNVTVESNFNLYHSLQIFYANGGGNCYITSIGGFDEDISPTKFIDGMKALEKYDEPTMLVFPDAALMTADNLKLVHQTALSQCALLGDRVAVLDLKETDSASTTAANFRDKIGTNNLKYGAAYMPYLRVELSPKIRFSTTSIRKNGAATTLKDIFDNLVASSLMKTTDDAYVALENIKTDTDKIATATTGNIARQRSDWSDKIQKINRKILFQTITAGDKTAIDADLTAAIAKLTAMTLTVVAADAARDDASAKLTAIKTEIAKPAPDSALIEADRIIFVGKMINLELEVGMTESAIATNETILRNTSSIFANIANAISSSGLIIPPSAVMAGVYTAVDAERGVWKAPANVSLNFVIEPTLKIDNFEQENLNVDVNGGKSINVIRAFTGKGTLVWGARTLMGNDNEWRYVPVRRFFNMVEESVKKSTEWAVFEPNDSKTWGKVKGMIDNYLYQKWMDGALAGARPDDAYFVKVGLGLTMTPQDVLEGRMIVEIGMAVVRPAEFIILKFSHKLQRS